MRCSSSAPRSSSTTSAARSRGATSRRAEARTQLLGALGRDSAQLRSELGFAKAQHGDVPGALVELERSVALLPSTPAYLNLGLLLEQQGRTAEALDAFDAAAGLDPADPRPPPLRGPGRAEGRPARARARLPGARRGARAGGRRDPRAAPRGRRRPARTAAAGR